MAVTKRVSNLENLPFRNGSTRGFSGNVHGCSGERAKLPLDYLATIASENARYETTRNAKITAVEHRQPPESPEDSRTAPDLLAADDRYTAAEKTAAAALLMSSLMRTRWSQDRLEMDDAADKRQQRWLRLNQNQEYRKKLKEIGVYPVLYGRKRYGCSVCHEVFEKEMFVWRHGVKHLRGKPFSCSECGGTFNRSDSLQRHVRNFHKKE